MAVNAIAPFVLCSRLKDVMMPFKLRSKEGPTSNTGGRGDDNNINSSTAKHAFTEANTGDCSSVDPPYSHIVNVTALEGKFNVGKKSGGHPHTNMAKAALNMMTLTGARDYARDGILMNSVDTGMICLLPTIFIDSLYLDPAPTVVS
jgi:NAD(P)-dependent dehydrogenase (short-subunit alcohol dehydrogenase family)